MDKYFSTRRIEALTDGVFAIAMTLLVLDLKVDDLGEIHTSGQLVEVISQNSTSIISFVVSFLLLGSMWAVHMRQFEYIKRADRHFTMINTVRLLVVVLMPLTTSMAGTYSNTVVGRVLLPLNFLLLALVSYWQWSYATHRKKLYDNLPKEIIEYSKSRNVAILITSIFVVIASMRLGQSAFLLFLLTPVYLNLKAR